MRFALVLAALVVIVACSGAEGGGPTVTVGSAVFDVDVASDPQDRARGLSGSEGLPDMSSMLFVFESGSASPFWMKGMLFPLDFIWIGDDCTVVDIRSRVPAPAPGTPDSQLPMYSSNKPATYTLEVNAGKVAELGLEIGDRVKFKGISEQGLTC